MDSVCEQILGLREDLQAGMARKALQLAMAPAHLVAQGVEFVDLDGPLLLAEDRSMPVRYESSLMHRPSLALWG